ncbi:TetR/AcrR family transcriptional regulator [Granulicella sp. WH15]|uniref:TetR/AcrR family transcriptional regulator n=1 Tax=Granulicella sp. WH15 TaxID=2602070 RepID=UPI0013678F44|nr:TetR/AcrR family transcriptional regulator [Granulicella sp. WH15]QHN03620.1 TetR/AcrR family transcriptional regulator [Granulicella sp. WH15]
MSESDSKSVDPRIRRSRLLLQEALLRLLKRKTFEDVSIQDVAEEATVNRATFYAHYPDKYALLECTTASRFQELLDERGVVFDGTCSTALRMMLVGICDYLEATRAMQCGEQLSMDPHLESAITRVVRQIILSSLKKQSWTSSISTEMTAATVTWALYGAAKEWVRTPNRVPAERIADDISRVVFPLLQPESARANFARTE